MLVVSVKKYIQTVYLHKFVMNIFSHKNLISKVKYLCCCFIVYVIFVENTKASIGNAVYNNILMCAYIRIWNKCRHQ